MLRRSPPFELRFLLLIGLLAPIAACSVRAERPSAGPSSGQLITAEAIHGSGVSTAWEAVARFGHHWSLQETLTGQPREAMRRGKDSIYLRQDPLLLVDGVQISDFRVLHQIPARDVSSIRLFSPTEASTYYGMRGASGAIMVRTMHAGSQ